MKIKYKNHLICLFLLCFILLTSCTPAANTPQEPAETNPMEPTTAPSLSPSQTPTLLPTEAPARTDTPAPTRTLRPTETPSTPVFSLSDLVGKGKIAYINGNDWVSLVYLRYGGSTDLTDPREVVNEFTNYTCALSWSPNGQQLAYASADQFRKGGDLYIISFGSGSGPISIAKDTICADWISDDEVIFVGSTEGRQDVPDFYYQDLFKIHPSGSDMKRITTQLVVNSLDVYLPMRQIAAEDMHSYPIINIYTVKGNSAPQTRKFQPLRNFQYRYPAWSPDGRMLAFAAQTKDSSNATEIFVANADGSRGKQLTDAEGFAAAPSWSPDGKFIAYKRNLLDDDPDFIGYNMALMVIDLKSGEERKLANLGTNYPMHSVSWSPDSRYITYDSNDEIMVVEVATGQAISVAYGGHAPIWSPVTYDCTDGWTRLLSSETARVVDGATETQMVIRSEPSQNGAQLGVLSPGSSIAIVGDPICADGLVYWQFHSAQFPEGDASTELPWVAEGNGTEYWLEPYEP